MATEEPRINIFEMIEDEVDSALINDKNIEGEIDKVNDGEATELPEDNEDEVLDLNVDYTTTDTAEIENIDADDEIAAERDIAFDAFEDDEIIDIAINSGNLSDEDMAIVDSEEISDEELAKEDD